MVTITRTLHRILVLIAVVFKFFFSSAELGLIVS